MQILVVEDHEATALILQSVLKRLGCIAAGKAGVSGFIIKPFSTEKLKAEIAEVFAK